LTSSSGVPDSTRFSRRGIVDRESFVYIQQIVAAATEALRADIADATRQTGVLTEGLRHELHLVAEGFQMHLDRSYADDWAIWTNHSGK
jgi:hypothetical protein